MLRLGVIGTNQITVKFIAAALETKKYQLHSVYSRSMERASAFSAKYQGEIALFSKMEEFLADKKLAVVYIASPNSVHFSQAREAIINGKNVIVEKPAFSTMEEMDKIIFLANRHQVFFFEAARNIHEQSFNVVKNFLGKSEKIYGADFNYAKYSTRMREVLAGGQPNIFSLKFSGGALMDLGVYQIYAALALFGKPRSVHYFATIGTTGVDVSGVGILRFEDFDVVINAGKNMDNFAPSQIFLANGTLVIDSLGSVSEVKFHSQSVAVKNLIIEPVANSLTGEALDFASVMLNSKDAFWGEKYEEWTELARSVNAVLVEMRKSAGIVFEADKQGG